MENRNGMCAVIFAGSLLLLLSCSSARFGSLNSTGLRVKVSADFSKTVSKGVGGTSVNATSGACVDLGASPTSDSPAMADGLDCDGDDGVVTHITPSSYTIAFKKVALLPDFPSKAWRETAVISDRNSLAASEVFTFNPENTSEIIVSLAPSSLDEGTYGPLEMQVYYVQMVIPVGGVAHNVRVYLSDDDFENEGNLGHHQGDIIYVADDGAELGWIDSTWTTLSKVRSENHNGPGGVDPQTGHARGFFGDAAFWNADAFNQGAGQDIFVTQIELPYPLNFPEPDTIQDLVTMTFQFPVANTFYYEDFAPRGTGFAPGANGEAATAGAERALLPSNATILDF